MRDYRLYLLDIKVAIDKIENFIKGMNFTEFSHNEQTIDAVIRNLEVIGEATKHIPKRIKNKYSEVDWKAIIGMRNVIVHEYFGVRLEIVWKTIKEKLPELKSKIEKILIENS